MTICRKVEFIGGPKDGQVYEVAGSASEIRIARPFYFSSLLFQMHATASVRIEYGRYCFQSSGDVFRGAMRWQGWAHE